MEKKDTETFAPKNRQEWRQWLHDNHDSKQVVWMIYYKNAPDKETISYSDAVDEDLCYGWIDSTLRSPGNGMLMQQFTRRKPKSIWSKINKDKIKRLIQEGAMAQPGIRSINIAKRNGSWSLFDAIEKLQMPRDLTTALNQFPGANKYFRGLSKSIKKQILLWLIQAKRPETREKRIREISELAAQQMKPSQFR